MIEWMAGKLAFSIKQANPEKTSSTDVMMFSLILLLNAFAIIVFSLVIGLATGKFSETAVTLFSFAILKFFSGGPHLKSSDHCVLVSTMMMTLLPHIPIYESWIVWISVVSLILVGLFSPSNMHKKARIPKKYYPLLKVISILIVSLNFILESDLLAKVFILQAIMLIPLKRR
jgi:accessory gene regulator B